MKRLLLAIAAVLCTTSAQAATVGYTIDIYTNYIFGCPSPAELNGCSAGPDSGYFTVTNSGSTTFTGTVGDVALSGGGTDYSFTSGPLTLAPGSSVNVGIGPESSNVGGFGGPTGTIQNGVQISLSGLFNGVEPVLLSVFDKDIHSGSARTSPCDGVTTDAYVLQGGAPKGCDNGDAFETTQAQGHFQFAERVSPAPEPTSLVLLGTGLFGAAIRRRNRGN